MIKVLIVEDDPMVAEFNKRFLEQIEGFQLVAVVSSAKEATLLLETNHIDLILLDIYMPGMNGLSFLTMLRKSEQRLDVIVISAARDKFSVEKALRNGAYDYLVKPFEFERFQYALKEYKKDKHFMDERESFTQSELDQFILHKRSENVVQEDLPKGLTKATLKTIWNSIAEYESRTFTNEEIANSVGISRVSIRKYLIFLSDIGVLEEETVYGSVGRPLYQYKLNITRKHIINHYL